MKDIDPYFLEPEAFVKWAEENRYAPSKEGIAFCVENWGMTEEEAAAWISGPIKAVEPALPCTFKMKWPRNGARAS